eukprot:COSAG02_NODE_32660_length_512_cov_4.130751_1_plen_58_part_10
MEIRQIKHSKQLVLSGDVFRGLLDAGFEGRIRRLQMAADGSAAAVGTHKGEVAFIGAD